MRRNNVAAAAVLILVMILATSCFQEPTDSSFGLDVASTELCDACLAAAPDPDSFEITIPESGKRLNDFEKSALGELPDYYDMTVDVSRGLNFWILGMLGYLDEILTYPPTQSADNTCYWGPFIPSGLSPVEVRFQMTQQSDTDYDYTWEQRPKNTDDDFTPVWGGSITPSTSTARLGVGTMFMDFTEAQRLDPTWDATGRLDVDYDTYTDGRRIDITFTEWDSEGLGVPANGTYHYHNHADNSGEFSFELQSAQFWPGSADESYGVVTQWMSDGTGIANNTISGGDLDGSYDGTECWDDLFRLTYYRYVTLNADGDPIYVDEGGDASACPKFE